MPCASESRQEGYREKQAPNKSRNESGSKFESRKESDDSDVSLDDPPDSEAPAVASGGSKCRAADPF